MSKGSWSLNGLCFTRNGYVRAVLVWEYEGWSLIGPLGCGAGMEIKERRGKNKRALQKLIEKELRDAGY